ncbi:hypothetical protein NN561_009548 [Cricetulus griseus]
MAWASRSALLRHSKEIWKFAMKEMGTPDVHIDTRLNKAVRAKRIRNVPYRIHVRLSRKRNEDEASPNKLNTLVDSAAARGFLTDSSHASRREGWKPTSGPPQSRSKSQAREPRTRDSPRPGPPPSPRQQHALPTSSCDLHAAPALPLLGDCFQQPFCRELVVRARAGAERTQHRSQIFQAAHALRKSAPTALNASGRVPATGRAGTDGARDKRGACAYLPGGRESAHAAQLRGPGIVALPDHPAGHWLPGPVTCRAQARPQPLITWHGARSGTESGSHAQGERGHKTLLVPFTGQRPQRGTERAGSRN